MTCDPEVFMAVREGHINIRRQTGILSVRVEFSRGDDVTALTLSYAEFLDLCNTRALMVPGAN